MTRHIYVLSFIALETVPAELELEKYESKSDEQNKNSQAKKQRKEESNKDIHAQEDQKGVKPCRMKSRILCHICGKAFAHRSSHRSRFKIAEIYYKVKKTELLTV